jgi:hypothetical protein
MKYLCILISIFFLSSCNNNSYVDNIPISQEFLNFTVKSGFPYINTLKKASKGDENAILQIIRFAYKTDDLNAVDHGVIFSLMVLNLGDDFFLNFIKKQDIEYRDLSAKMFEAAIEYDKDLSDLNIKLKHSFEYLFEK